MSERRRQKAERGGRGGAFMGERHVHVSGREEDRGHWTRRRLCERRGGGGGEEEEEGWR